MKTLILMRHAKSSWKQPSGSDFDRPLNDRGKRDAPEMGRRLRARKIAVNLLVTSPAERARQTGRIIANELGLANEQIVENDAVYEAGAGELLSVIRSFDDTCGSILLVGHNPSMTYVVNALSGDHLDNLPTCGLYGLQFDLHRWQDVAELQGRTLFYDYPKRRD